MNPTKIKIIRHDQEINLDIYQVFYHERFQIKKTLKYFAL